jgi:uncharacterized protein (DUF302 family)
MRIVTIALTALVLLAAGPLRAEPLGTQVLYTDHAYQELAQRLNQAIKDNDMYAVTRASASAGASNRGIDIPGNMVVGVYRNDFAVRMLEASIPAGIEAPIRFYITEESDGTAALRYREPSAVFAPYVGGGEKLNELARELDAIFAAIAKQATGQ